MRTVCKLRHDAEIGLGLKPVQHLDYVLVPQVAQDLNLLTQVAHILLAFPVLANELHRCYLAGELAPPLIYLPLQLPSLSASLSQEDSLANTAYTVIPHTVHHTEPLVQCVCPAPSSQPRLRQYCNCMHDVFTHAELPLLLDPTSTGHARLAKGAFANKLYDVVVVDSGSVHAVCTAHYAGTPSQVRPSK